MTIEQRIKRIEETVSGKKSLKEKEDNSDLLGHLKSAKKSLTNSLLVLSSSKFKLASSKKVVKTRIEKLADEIQRNINDINRLSE